MTRQRTACWTFSIVAMVSAATVAAWLLPIPARAAWLLILLPLIAGLAALWTYAKLIAPPYRSGIPFAALRGAAVAAAYLLTHFVFSLLIAAGGFDEQMSPLESLYWGGYVFAVGAVSLIAAAAIAIGAATGIVIERIILKTI